MASGNGKSKSKKQQKTIYHLNPKHPRRRLAELKSDIGSAVHSGLGKIKKTLGFEGSGGPDDFSDELGNASRYPIDAMPEKFRAKEIARRQAMDAPPAGGENFQLDENSYNPRAHNGSFKFKIAFERKGYKVGK